MHDSYDLLGVVILGRPITISSLCNWLKLLKFRWPNLRCQSQPSLVLAARHSTYAGLINVWKVLFLDSGDFNINLCLESNNCKSLSFITTKNPFSINWPIPIRLHFIPSTNKTSSIIEALLFFLRITNFPMPSAISDLLSASLIWVFLLGSNSIYQSL